MTRRPVLIPFLCALGAASVALAPAAAQRRQNPPKFPSSALPDRVKRGAADVPKSPTRPGDPTQLNPQPLPPEPKPDPRPASPLPRG